MRRLNAKAPEEEEAPRPDQNQIMDLTAKKLQFRAPSVSLSNKPTFFSRSFPPNKPSKSKYFVVVVSLITLFVLLYVIVVKSIGARSSNVAPKKYGIVIDGGSTGTRMHVFEYEIVDRGSFPEFDFGKGGLSSMRVNPGLSSYEKDTDGAGGSLMELLEFAKGRVPRECWGATEIRLMATAGLRSLDLKVQEKILESCKRVLRSSGFRFRDDWASVITATILTCKSLTILAMLDSMTVLGSDEGLYAWVVANYALGTLGGDPQDTTGIIELGGASAQVTFVTDEPIPPQFSHTVKFGNFTYHLYSHSLLHFGQNAAMDLLRGSLVSRTLKRLSGNLQKLPLTDPCSPRGYSLSVDSWSLPPDSLAEIKQYYSVVASGNFSSCRSASFALLQEGREKCSYKKCHIGSTFIPKLHGKFLATENFFHTSKFFGLDPKATLSDLMMAGEQFCQEDWSKLRKKYHSLDIEDLHRYCFSSAYIVALLHDSLGVALNDQRIGFANQVGETPLDWALGAFLLQTTADMQIDQPDWIATIISDESPTLLSLTGVCILLLFTAWSVSKWKKTQIKTIYDLEKGRYIVTRIGR